MGAPRHRPAVPAAARDPGQPRLGRVRAGLRPRHRGRTTGQMGCGRPALPVVDRILPVRWQPGARRGHPRRRRGERAAGGDARRRGADRAPGRHHRRTSAGTRRGAEHGDDRRAHRHRPLGHRAATPGRRRRSADRRGGDRRQRAAGHPWSALCRRPGRSRADCRAGGGPPRRRPRPGLAALDRAGANRARSRPLGGRARRPTRRRRAHPCADGGRTPGRRRVGRLVGDLRARHRHRRGRPGVCGAADRGGRGHRAPARCAGRPRAPAVDRHPRRARNRLPRRCAAELPVGRRRRDRGRAAAAVGRAGRPRRGRADRGR